MSPVVVDGVALSVCWSVCLSDCLWRSWAQQKLAEPVEMPFWLWTWLGPRNHVLAPPGEHEWTIHVRRRCGLRSSYFDHLLLLSLNVTYVDLLRLNLLCLLCNSVQDSSVADPIFEVWGHLRGYLMLNFNVSVKIHFLVTAAWVWNF